MYIYTSTLKSKPGRENKEDTFIIPGDLSFKIVLITQPKITHQYHYIF